MKEIWQNITNYWNRQESRVRFGLIVGLFVIVTVIGMLAWWIFSADYKVLFSDLAERDAAVILDELKKEKIPYKLDDSGTKILVKSDHVHDTRIGLMGKGLPLTGNVGFEIFDNKDASMTEYTQKINYQRALQGELARTIMAIDKIKFARVHLVIPEASIFQRQKLTPKASVSLILKPGFLLTTEQILGIQRLVGASVPSLDASKVTVLDQQGVILSTQVDADEKVEAMSGKLRMKKEIEGYLSRKIIDVLDRAYGTGQAIVSVDVTINYDEIKSTQEEILPSTGSLHDKPQGVIVKKRESIQKPASVTRKSSDDTNSVHESGAVNETTEIEYQLSKRVEQIISNPGKIQHISVGVIVPKDTSPSQVDKMLSMVSSIIGLQTSRGDTITVQSINDLVYQAASKHDNKAVIDSPGEQAKKNLVADDKSMFITLQHLYAQLGINGIWQWIVSILTVLIPALLLSWLMAKFMYANRSGPKKSQTLSPHERQAMLNDLKLMLSTGKTK